MLPPAEVVKTATEAKKMGKFDSLNYETALNMYNKYGNSVFKIYNYNGFSINLSSDSLKSNEWLRQLKRFIINNHMPEGYIIFEVNEQDIYENLGRVRVWINDLIGYKITWSVDNYNNEYYSIKELKDFGFSIIKTSRKLLLDAMSDPVYKGIIELVVAECDKRHIKLVAQGVETTTQVKFVEDTGFKYAQGYSFYKPLKTDELIEAIQTAKKEEDESKAPKAEIKSAVMEKEDKSNKTKTKKSKAKVKKDKRKK